MLNDKMTFVTIGNSACVIKNPDKG